MQLTVMWSSGRGAQPSWCQVNVSCNGHRAKGKLPMKQEGRRKLLRLDLHRWLLNICIRSRALGIDCAVDSVELGALGNHSNHKQAVCCWLFQYSVRLQFISSVSFHANISLFISLIRVLLQIACDELVALMFDS